jgi:RNA polymerase sigma-70 factor (ECF subfamily)
VQLDERELVARAQSGDQTALGMLYDAHYARVYGYIRYKLGNREDAEDLAQETFIRMLDALDRYEQRGAPFRAWLMQIAANLVRDHYRRKGTSGASIGVDVGELDVVGGGDPAEAMAVQLALEEVAGALHLLTETEREILLLRYAADLSIAETAAAAQKTENNVKQLTFKALTKLRKALAKGDALAGQA